MTKIVLELEAAEALFALAAIQSAGAKAHHTRRMLIETSAPSDETAIAESSAQMYDRLETRITDQLYPEDPRRVLLREEIELGMV